MIVHNVDQGTEQWLQLRCGKITGTRFKRLFSTKWLELLDLVVSEKLTGNLNESDYVSEDMQRGKDYEPLAAHKYSQHTGTTLYTAGFIQHPSIEFIGMSPDRLIINSEATVIGAVEFKCPNPNTHVRYIRQNKLPSEHLYQTIYPFFISDKIQYVDFVSFCPEIKQLELFIVRTHRNSVLEYLSDGNKRIDKFQDELKSLYDNITGVSESGNREGTSSVQIRI